MMARDTSTKTPSQFRWLSLAFTAFLSLFIASTVLIEENLSPLGRPSQQSQRSLFADALWTVSYTFIPSGVAPMLTEQWLSRGSQRVVLSHDSVQFSRDMGNDRTLFPGTCFSSSQNAYGWNRWKYDLFRSATPVAVTGRQITLTITGLASFSPTENETVTCYPGTIGQTGKSYALSTLSADDSSVSFTIMRSPLTPKAKLVLRDSLETEIRKNGFHLAFEIESDVWDPSEANGNTLLGGLSCTPANGADCVWFRSIIANKKYSGFNASQPNTFYIYVDRTETRTLNILNDMEIVLSLPRSNGERYGLKTGMILDLQAIDAKVTVKAVSPPPSVTITKMPHFKFNDVPPQLLEANLTGLAWTEACLRGRATYDNACPGVLWFEVPLAESLSGRNFLGAASEQMKNLNETTFYSTQLGEYLQIVPVINGAKAHAGTQRFAYAFLIFPLAAVSYDISQTDNIQIRLPYNIFANYEPPLPTNVLTLTITPSNGEVQEWSLPNITQNTFWKGGHSIRIKLGGESFLPSVLTSFLSSSYVTGSLNAGDGWDRWRQCAVNNTYSQGEGKEAVAFGTKLVTRNGVLQNVTDYQTLIVNFASCPDYNMARDEVIRINIPSSWLTSTRQLVNTGMLFFNVEKSPGMYAVSGKLNYLEQEMMRGEVTFSLSFLGGEKLVAMVDWAACSTALVDAWETDSVRDANGWGNRNIREQLLRGAAVRVSDTQLQFQFNASDLYDTRRGESINISSIPAACFVNGKTIYSSSPTYLVILPMKGTIKLGYQYPNAPIIWENNVTESMMRRGGYSWIVVVEGDTFDDERAVDFGRNIAFGDIDTPSLEPSGFAAMKQFLIHPEDIQYDTVSKRQITIPIRATVKFDVRNDENIYVNVNKNWMTSQQDPTNPKDSIFFTIQKSAGDIKLVDWYGKDKVVTEQDVRDGNVWFTFGLLGDQWRAERSPYLTAFSSNETSPTAFMALSEQILPSIEFFTFSSGDAFEYLTIKLQSNERYDVATNEVLVLSFPGTTVVSDLAPSFSGEGVVDGKQFITIHVVAGAVTLSGMTKLNEKLVRQGGVKLYLTLFGEQWLADTVTAALCVRHAITSKLRDFLFNTTLLPYNGVSGTGQSAIYAETASVMVIPFSSDKTQTINYDIPADVVDIFKIGHLRACVKSQIEPKRRVLRALILPTEGELRLESLTPPVVTEVTLRTTGLTIKLQLDGDQWTEEVRHSERATDLVGGFGSLSSSITEPSGFYANRQTMLGLGLGQSPEVRITSNTLEIIVNPAPNYNIDNDEVITFSVPSDEYVLGGVLPSPSTISFTVLAITRTIILIIDPSRPGSMTNGRFDTDILRGKIASILSCQDLSRIHAVVNTTRADNMVVVPLAFVGSTSVIEKRNNNQLGKVFMGYSRSYLDTAAGIKSLYWEDDGAPKEETGIIDGNANSFKAAESSDDFVTMIWGVSAAGFMILVVAGYFVVMRIRQAELGGMVRKGLNPVPEDRYGLIEDDDDFFDREVDIGEDGSVKYSAMKEMSPRGDLNQRNKIVAPSAKSPTKKGAAKNSGSEFDDIEAQHQEMMRQAALQYKHASRMFAEKQRARQGQASHQTVNARDPANPNLVPKDPLVDRPMTLKEYASKRLLQRDPDARKVQEIVDSARQRLQAASMADNEEEIEALMKANKKKNAASAAAASAAAPSTDEDENFLSNKAEKESPEERRARLAFAEDILLQRQREAAEIAARERASRRMMAGGNRRGSPGGESDDEDLFGVDARRKATQARIEQMLEGFS